MAADNELQIVLSLIDNASAQLKKITGDIKKDTEGISKESDKATKSLSEGMKESGKALKDFRREMFIVTAAIAATGFAVREWGKHNYETKRTLDEIQVSIKNITAAIGSLFVPAVINAGNTLKGLLNIINPIIKVINELQISVYQIYAAIGGLATGGIGKAISSYKEFGETARKALTENIPQTDLLKKKFEDMNTALDKLNLMYLTGTISAKQYYDELSKDNIANFQNMQMQMQLTQQLAQQENLMRNQSLMDYSADIQARMGLLKTLQNYHHTVYSSMMNFTNMFIQQFSSGMTNALTSIIMGTKKASEAFKEFGIAMITAIVEFVIQYGIQMLIAWALSNIIMASTVAQASVIAAAWLPAAIYASIATLGAADAAGATGFATGTAAMLGSAAAVNLGTITVSKPAAKAEGGWVGLNGPEIALVGERGPEYVVPNNRLGSMGGQTSIHIEINNPTVRSDEDIDKLTEEISQRLAREAERL